VYRVAKQFSMQARIRPETRHNTNSPVWLATPNSMSFKHISGIVVFELFGSSSLIFRICGP